MTVFDQFSNEELQVTYFVLGSGFGIPSGSFVTSLIDSIFKADMTNRAKLRIVFPAYVDAVDAYVNGDLHSRIMAWKNEQKEQVEDDTIG